MNRQRTLFFESNQISNDWRISFFHSFINHSFINHSFIRSFIHSSSSSSMQGDMAQARPKGNVDWPMFAPELDLSFAGVEACFANDPSSVYIPSADESSYGDIKVKKKKEEEEKEEEEEEKKEEVNS